MRTTRLRLSRRMASRMLDDPAAHARDGGLGEILSAAASPRADLAADSEERAVTAFRSVAHPVPVPTHGGTSVMTRFTRKVATAPAAALTAAAMVLAGGGIALAASHGAVHVPFTGHDNRASDAPSATATVNPGLTVTPGAEPSDDPTTEAPETPDASPSAVPTPSLDGLCVAYQAGALTKGKAAANPAFTALATAAGGASNIQTFCVSRIGVRQHPARPTQPTHPTHPAKPTQAVTPDHAAGHRVNPPVHPSGAPAFAHPGAPATH